MVYSFIGIHSLTVFLSVCRTQDAGCLERNHYSVKQGFVLFVSIVSL